MTPETKTPAVNPPCAPILLIGFNRPDFMTAQIAAIRTAQPRKVYVAVDGPREGRTDEAEKCRAVRDCVKAIDWPCEVKTLFREKNLGCKHGPFSAMDWFFSNEESGIVLEDDCRPTQDFLLFATLMLERYKTDARVAAINGFNTFNLQSSKSSSYHFSCHMDVWGWASWRRVWRNYDLNIARHKEFAKKIIHDSHMSTRYKKMFYGFVDDLSTGLDAWDIQFSIMLLLHGWWSIVPKTRLVANAGLADDRATHTGGYIYWGKDWSKAGTLEFPLIHPEAVVCDDAADRLREKIECAIFPRGLTWLGAKFPFLCGLMTFIGKVAEKISPFLFRW